jgi:hypothetical protein
MKDPRQVTVTWDAYFLEMTLGVWWLAPADGEKTGPAGCRFKRCQAIRMDSACCAVWGGSGVKGRGNPGDDRKFRQPDDAADQVQRSFRTLRDQRCCLLHHFLFAGEGQHLHRLVDGDPTRLVDLVVVVADLAGQET